VRGGGVVRHALRRHSPSLWPPRTGHNSSSQRLRKAMRRRASSVERTVSERVPQIKQVDQEKRARRFSIQLRNFGNLNTRGACSTSCNISTSAAAGPQRRPVRRQGSLTAVASEYCLSKPSGGAVTSLTCIAQLGLLHRGKQHA
jgi:hypothetical protein